MPACILPDGVTSTGYLRTGETVNNGRVESKFGAFFVAGPDSPVCPARTCWTVPRTIGRTCFALQYGRAELPHDQFGSASALEAGGPKHSISAVGRDGTGAILFILCREPITGVDFGALLLALPIDVRVVMYTEGGSLAGLFLRTPVRSDLAGAFLAGVLGFRKPGLRWPRHR